MKDVATGSFYILMQARLQALYKKEEEYEILDSFKGESLFGKGYKPLFPYFAQVCVEKTSLFFYPNFILIAVIYVAKIFNNLRCGARSCLHFR